MNFFFENLSLVPETREVMEHFQLVFGSGTSDLAKIRPLKVWTSWISPWVPPYGILPRVTSSRRPKIVIYVSKLLVRVSMNRLDPEKLLELLVTVSKAIYQKPKYLRW